MYVQVLCKLSVPFLARETTLKIRTNARKTDKKVSEATIFLCIRSFFQYNRAVSEIRQIRMPRLYVKRKNSSRSFSSRNPRSMIESKKANTAIVNEVLLTTIINQLILDSFSIY